MISAFNPSWLSEMVADFERKIGVSDFQLYVWPQVWGSTALGYPGIGGSAMTYGTTVVLYDNKKDIAFVYPGTNRLGYVVSETSDKFWDAVNNRNVFPAGNKKLLSKYGIINSFKEAEIYRVVFKDTTTGDWYVSPEYNSLLVTVQELMNIYDGVRNLDEFKKAARIMFYRYLFDDERTVKIEKLTSKNPDIVDCTVLFKCGKGVEVLKSNRKE